MYFINYAFMSLFIGIYLYFQWSDLPVPEYLNQVRVWASWAFLLWGGFLAGRVIVDCLLLSAKGQMSTANAVNGFLLAVLQFLPIFLMSLFTLRAGFVGK